MTPAELTKMGVRADRAQAFAPALTESMREFHIDTPMRKSAFLAQILHESGMLKYTRELWGPTPAQSRYEGRQDLGNTHIGDGFRFRGRGLIQTTGRDNYAATGRALGLDLIRYPEALEAPLLAARSAAWWWQAHKLNELADTGDIERISRRVNGGTNGMHERTALYRVTQGVLA